MINGFDKDIFANILKGIRTSLNMTQNEVALESQLNTETIRRLEKGVNIPSLRTLEDLSVVYNIDLLKVFMLTRSSNDYYKFYDYLDDLIIHYDLQHLIKVKTEFEIFIKKSTSEYFSSTEIKQFRLILMGIELCYSSKTNLIKSTDYFLEALRYSIPLFDSDYISKFKYKYLDLKCLLLIATNLSESGRHAESIEILSYISNNELIKQSYCYNDTNLNKLQLKLYLNLSYNYHCINQHIDVLRYVNLGIDNCITNSTMYLLHFFYYRKAVYI